MLLLCAQLLFQSIAFVVIGGVEILWSEERTQSNPVAMAVYAIAIIPLILMVLKITDQYPHGTYAADYADDFTVPVLYRKMDQVLMGAFVPVRSFILINHGW